MFDQYPNGVPTMMPYGFAPQPQMPMMYQPQRSTSMPPMQQPAPQQAQPQIQTNKIYANGVDDVRNRQVPANSDYIFLDNDKPLIYRKTVDATGKMSVETFKIVPYEETPEIKPEYALKSDIDALRQEIESLKPAKTKGGEKNA